LVIDIIRKANKKILIIDNYVDDSILKMLTKKKCNVEVVILTSGKSNIQQIDIQKFNKEYPILKVAKTNKFHDRFIIIDNKEMYHLGASIKDLGKKCFGINKLVILSIFRIIPYILTLIIVILTILITDKTRFKQVDYALLATFCVFFIFSGNIAKIPAIKEFIANIVVNNTLLAGIVSCQFISNVPTAIFLSKFTMNYRELLIAVNIGSLGILISSLASLITLKEFLKHQPKKFGKYIGMFTLFNTLFLIVLLLITNLQ